MHVLVLGLTGQGKTSQVLELIKKFKGRSRPVAVLTPKLDDHPRYKAVGADLVTADRALFLKVVRSPKTRGAIIVIDEGGQTIGRYDKEMEALFTDARHSAITVIVIAHRWTGQLNVTVREQCTKLFCFKQGMKDATNLAHDWGHEGLRAVFDLEPMQFIYCTTSKGSLRMGRVHR